MFLEDDIEEAANNELVNPTETNSSDSPTEIDKTKAFATRLKEEKAKAKLEVQEEIAQSFGYNSWKEYSEAQTNSKLVDKGLDPDEVRPVLQDLIKNDPEYIEAMKYKAEKEELEKELFASNSIQALNNTVGTDYKSVNELDEETIKMWNAGTPLEKAYAANNWSKIAERAVRKTITDSGKSHLTNATGTNENGTQREVSKDELSVFKMFGYSEDQVKDYYKKHK